MLLVPQQLVAAVCLYYVQHDVMNQVVFVGTSIMESKIWNP